jgi:hypothetical protein
VVTQGCRGNIRATKKVQKSLGWQHDLQGQVASEGVNSGGKWRGSAFRRHNLSFVGTRLGT